MTRSIGSALACLAAIVIVSPPHRAGAYTVAPVEGGGSISGVVAFEKDYPSREFVRVDKDNATCGVRHESEAFVVDPDSRGLQNVVAVLEGGYDLGALRTSVETVLQELGG